VGTFCPGNENILMMLRRKKTHGEVRPKEASARYHFYYTKYKNLKSMTVLVASLVCLISTFTTTVGN
jgi:hypothetical protein